MARTVTLHISVQEPGEDQVGFWCAACALPSGVEFNLIGLSEVGVSRMGAIRRCTGCGGRNVESP